jgi:hypothetical protein
MRNCYIPRFAAPSVQNCVVYLEPEVLRALIAFRKWVAAENVNSEIICE